ncbi:hypothetical protein I79_020183 [Cricetulus griseus]|uniref:Uncharacterized protein n=1 Tax=Cricetulus griseus TaxID=10029 RepID=G3I9E2_CRIGR|nr:hypothetical protein I79_020183 [Cricetulus griseus]
MRRVCSGGDWTNRRPRGLAHPCSVPQSRKAEAKSPQSSDRANYHKTPKTPWILVGMDVNIFVNGVEFNTALEG